MAVDPGELLKTRPTKLLVLLKIAKKERLEQIQAGKIYCRHLKYYRDGEGGADLQPWQDRDEGVAGIFQSKSTRLVFKTKDGAEHVVDAEGGLLGQVKISRDLNVPAFCLHAIHAGEWTDRSFGPSELADFMKHLEVPERMKSEFGDHVLVIGPEFVDRVTAACRQQKITFHRGLVKYIDESEAHGKIPADLVGFVKLKKFDWQREYRFVFEATDTLPDPFILDVGPLHDVTQIVTLDDFRKNVRFEFNDEPPAQEPPDSGSGR